MTVGEFISALKNKDSSLMEGEICGISIKGDCIDISFVDSNTEVYNVAINGEENKVGHWIPLYDEDGTQETEEYYGEIYKCSKCGRSDFNTYYCSYCGAKMDNGEMD